VLTNYKCFTYWFSVDVPLLHSHIVRHTVEFVVVGPTHSGHEVLMLVLFLLLNFESHLSGLNLNCL
jgi:hypothetical protein